MEKVIKSNWISHVKLGVANKGTFHWLDLIFSLSLSASAKAAAPPHGLAVTDEMGDNMPGGCPSNNDPVDICRQMAEQGIILYCVGCEPALAPFRDFFMGLAHITGGQYVSLNRANRLSQVSRDGEVL